MHLFSPVRLPVMALVALSALFSGPALADAIDGDWCHADGQQLSINGPDIVTPGGTRLKGDYDRHHFSCVVPAAGPRAGATIYMTLMDELQLRLKPPAGEEQFWWRCGKPVS